MWCVVSGVHHEVDENLALLGYYAMSSGNLLSIFQNNLLVPSSWVKKKCGGLIGCPKTSVRNYQYSLFNNPEECSSHLLT